MKYGFPKEDFTPFLKGKTKPKTTNYFFPADDITGGTRIHVD